MNKISFAAFLLASVSSLIVALGLVLNALAPLVVPALQSMVGCLVIAALVLASGLLTDVWKKLVLDLWTHLRKTRCETVIALANKSR